MALMDHSSRSKSQNKDGGGLPSREIKTTGAAHYLPTARQVYATCGDHQNTKRTIQLRLCKCNIVLDRTQRSYCPLCGRQQSYLNRQATYCNCRTGTPRSDAHPMGRKGATHIRPRRWRTHRWSVSHTRHQDNGNHAAIVSRRGRGSPHNNPQYINKIHNWKV